MLAKVAPFAKAIVAGIIAALTSLQATLTVGTLTTQSYVQAALAFFIGLGAVSITPNVSSKTNGK
jgi:hypothetical protein